MANNVNIYAWSFVGRIVGLNKIPFASLILRDKEKKIISHIVSNSFIDIKRCSISTCDFRNFTKGMLTEANTLRVLETE